MPHWPFVRINLIEIARGRHLAKNSFKRQIYFHLKAEVLGAPNDNFRKISVRKTI